jgi:hypothetical protein
VRVEDAPVIQPNELMLAQAIHGGDQSTFDGAALPRRHPSPQCGMMEHERGDAASNDVAAEIDDGSLYFRKLRHGVSFSRACATLEPF